MMMFPKQSPSSVSGLPVPAFPSVPSPWSGQARARTASMLDTLEKMSRSTGWVMNELKLNCNTNAK